MCIPDVRRDLAPISAPPRFVLVFGKGELGFPINRDFAALNIAGGIGFELGLFFRFRGSGILV